MFLNIFLKFFIYIFVNYNLFRHKLFHDLGPLNDNIYDGGLILYKVI